RNGIVCLVTNNSFVDQLAFDGMRKHLAQNFSRIYHVHLEGNVRQNPKLAGTIYNVFGIQVGVGITLAVRAQKHCDHRVFFHRLDKQLHREEKLAWLKQKEKLSGVDWQQLRPDGKHHWLAAENSDAFAQYLPIASKVAKGSRAADAEAVFKSYGRGVATCRDEAVYDYDPRVLTKR